GEAGGLAGAGLGGGQQVAAGENGGDGLALDGGGGPVAPRGDGGDQGGREAEGGKAHGVSRGLRRGARRGRAAYPMAPARARSRGWPRVDQKTVDSGFSLGPDTAMLRALAAGAPPQAARPLPYSPPQDQPLEYPAVRQPQPQRRPGGQPGIPGLPGHDPDPGPESAGHPRRSGSDRPGQDR